jgi:hypothetical protein
MKEMGAAEADGNLRVLAQTDDARLHTPLPATPAGDLTEAFVAYRFRRYLRRHLAPPSAVPPLTRRRRFSATSGRAADPAMP